MVPVWLSDPFWALLAVTPAGSSNVIVQPLSAVLLLLLTTNLPCVPLPVNSAVSGAGGGGGSPLPSQLARLMVQLVGCTGELRVKVGLNGSVLPPARTVSM